MSAIFIEKLPLTDKEINLWENAIGKAKLINSEIEHFKDCIYIRCALLNHSTFMYLDRKEQRVKCRQANFDRYMVRRTAGDKFIFETIRLRPDPTGVQVVYHGLLNQDWEEVVQPKFTHIRDLDNLIECIGDTQHIVLNIQNGRTLFDFSSDNCYKRTVFSMMLPDEPKIIASSDDLSSYHSIWVYITLSGEIYLIDTYTLKYSIISLQDEPKILANLATRSVDIAIKHKGLSKILELTVASNRSLPDSAYYTKEYNLSKILANAKYL